MRCVLVNVKDDVLRVVEIVFLIFGGSKESRGVVFFVGEDVIG